MGSSVKVNGYYISEVATWETAAPDANSTWLYVGHLGNEELGKEQMFDDAQEANSVGARTPRNPTVKGGSFTLRVRVRTGSKGDDGASGDTAPTTCYAQKLLENAFGVAAVHNAGTTVAAASGPGASTPLKVTSATNMALGMAIQIGSEMRVIVGISGTDITLNKDLLTSANYDAGTVIYGGFFFVPTLGSYAKYIYLTHVTGAKVDMLQRCRVTNFKIVGLGAKEGLRYEFTLQADSYTRSGVTPTSIPAETFTGTPIVAKSGTLFVGTTAIAVRTASVEFNMVHEEQEAATTSGAESGRQSFDITGLDGGSVTMEEQYRGPTGKRPPHAECSSRTRSAATMPRRHAAPSLFGWQQVNRPCSRPSPTAPAARR
jgi:hypothetical protein